MNIGSWLINLLCNGLLTGTVEFFFYKIYRRKKENKYGNCIRIMDWNYDEITSREYTKINYIIDDKSYHDTHEFLIYKIDKIKEILNKYNLNYRLYENYSFSDANKMSKNIEIVINK